MMYLDLAEVECVLSMCRLWGRSRWRPARFRREDYLGPPSLPLDEAVRRRVEESLGWRPTGPIRMLTHVRYFGYIFNPVTFYYCFDGSGRVSAIVAEITNTPWGERHTYVLDSQQPRPDPTVRPMRWRFAKDFHVSPFLPLDLQYDWTFTQPADSLLVHMNVRDSHEGVPRVFDATLRLKRREITPARLRNVLFQYPLLTAQIILKIHLEALRLWIRRAPVFPHPGAAALPTPSTTRGLLR